MLKTITFAIMHFTIAFAVTYLITGSFVLGGLIAVIEPAVNTVGYFSMRKSGKNTAKQSWQQNR